MFGIHRHDWVTVIQATHHQMHPGESASCPVYETYRYWQRCETCGAQRPGNPSHDPRGIVLRAFSNQPPAASDA